MPDSNPIQKYIFGVFYEIFKPIKKAAESAVYRDELLAVLGWYPEDIASFPISALDDALSQTSALLTDLNAIIDDPPQDISDVIVVIDMIGDVIAEVKSISLLFDQVPTLSPALLDELGSFGEDLVSYLVSIYIREKSFKAYSLLSLLGLLDIPEVSGGVGPVSAPGEDWMRYVHAKPTFHLDRIVDLISNPIDYFKTLYYPASGVINSEAEARIFSNKFFPRLVRFVVSLGADADYGVNPLDEPYYTASAYNIISRTFSSGVSLTDGLSVGSSLLIAKTPSGLYGLLIKLFGDLEIEKALGKYYLALSISEDIDAIAIDNDGVHFTNPITGSSFGVNVMLTRIFGENQSNVFGNPNGTRLGIRELAFGGFLDISSVSRIYGLIVALHGVEAYIKGSDGDGFIQKIFKNPIGVKFDLDICWDNVRGLYFRGSGGLEVYFPAHTSIGPVELNGLRAGIVAADSAVKLYTGADICAKLGPVVVVIDGIGIKADITFPGDGGNLGFADFHAGFKFPNGIGLSITTPVVKGEGYLYINPDRGLYYGALELKIKDKITVSAIGIITTKAPDGSPGFSLLILANVVFPGIPIGFGFSLNGIGLLGAINRSLDPDAIQAGVRNGAIDRIVFPEEVVENISRIIADLDSFFPVQEKQYTFGLFFLLYWGTGVPLVKIKLGLIISLPDPVRLAIIGNIQVALPDPDAPVVLINVAFAGIIDFDNKYLSFDAHIYDSRIAIFSLSGDMAVRVFWGRYREVVLSSGGFHPNYNPPAYLKLPARMERLTFGIQKEHFSIVLTSYFAVTSNTVQLGASLLLDAEFGPVKAKGYLGFDTLFQFNPFYFIAQIRAGIAVYYKSNELLGVDLFLQLDGPTPWHAAGHAEFTIVGISKKIQFDKTWNEDQTPTTLPGIEVAPLIKEALEHEDSWSAELPENKPFQLVTIRNLENKLVLQPAGVLQIIQKVAPLGVSIQKLGSQKIDDGGYYDITSVTVGTGSEATVYTAIQGLRPVDGNFSPAQYRDMDAQQKLKAAGFEYLKGGVSIEGTNDLYFDHYSVKEMSYEVITVDDPAESLSAGSQPLPDMLVNRFTGGGAIASNSLGKQMKSRKQKFESISRSKPRQESYKLVSRDGLRNLSTLFANVSSSYSSQTDARTQAEVLLAANPAWKNLITIVPQYL